jgi:hypothetical protein
MDPRLSSRTQLVRENNMNTDGNPAMHSKKNGRAPRPATDTSMPEKEPADASAPVVSVPTGPAQRAKPEKGSAAPAPSGGRRSRIKEAFVRQPARRPGKEVEMPEMEPPRRRRTSANPEPEPGYLVLRMRLSGDRLRVIDSRAMPGPLRPDLALTGSHAYEVAVSGRLVHTGSLPDLGVQRSFANPQAKEGVETGHHIAERRTVDFTVRVPAAEVTEETLEQVEVVLLRVKGDVQIDRLDDEPVSTRFPRELRPVARLRGLTYEPLRELVRERDNPTTGDKV